MPFRRYALYAFAVFAMLSSGAVAEEYWNQYRGPRGDGTCDAKGLPTTWSDKEHIKWSTPFPSTKWKAWSSPVIWKDQIWFTTAPPFKNTTSPPKSSTGEPATVDEPTQLYAVCLDLASGKMLRNILVFDIPHPQFCIERNSY